MENRWPPCPAAPSSPRSRPRPALAAVGCGGGGAPPASGGGRTPVRFAMDWTPNTNHTGLYAAQQQGWFADAGLDVQILPYNSTSPDTLVSSGAAEFGISFQDSFTVSKAAGADIVSVLAVLQHWGTAIGVRADRADLRSPRDLDGKTYGGFGAAYEVPKMQAIIRAAGGKGDFKNVVLGTSAYEALYAGQVDFTEPFLAWEGIEAELRNEPLKTFAYADYGFPDAYSVIVIGNPGVDEGAPGRRGRVRGRAAAGLPARRGRPRPGRQAADRRQPGRVHRARRSSPAARRCWPSAT